MGTPPDRPTTEGDRARLRSAMEGEIDTAEIPDAEALMAAVGLGVTRSAAIK